MALSSPITLSHGGTTNKVDFDIFKDDNAVAQDLLNIKSDYQSKGIACAFDILLDSNVPCQVKINNGTWQSFLYDTVYSLSDLRNVKSVVLSTNNIKYHINIVIE